MHIYHVQEASRHHKCLFIGPFPTITLMARSGGEDIQRFDEENIQPYKRDTLDKCSHINAVT